MRGLCSIACEAAAKDSREQKGAKPAGELFVFFVAIHGALLPFWRSPMSEVRR